MDTTPQNTRDFRFMGASDIEKLEYFVRQIADIRVKSDLVWSAGNVLAKASPPDPVPLPKRDYMQPGSQYDEDIRQWARTSLDRQDHYMKHVQQQWENCIDVCDYMLDLLTVRGEARKFMHSDKPVLLLPAPQTSQISKGKHTARLESHVANHAHSALQKLQKGMENFTRTPLLDVHGSFSDDLAELAKSLKEVKQEHKRFLAAIDYMEPEEIHEHVTDFRKQAVEYGKTLTNINQAIHTCMQDVPELSIPMHIYKSINAHGIGRA